MTTEVSKEGRVLTALAAASTPAEMVAALSKVDDFDVLVVCFEDSGNDAIRALLKRAITVGRAHELASHGDGITKKLAEKFGVSERSMERQIRTYHEIIKPRLERDGPHAQFLLEERAFYDIACEAAPVVKIPAVELIEQAEEKKAADAKFSATRWRKELGLSGDEGSTTSEGGKLWRLLKKLAQWDDAAIAEAVECADARKVLDDARDALVAAKAAVDLLEERTKGRVE